MKIFAVVSYKGTNYQGWQKQTNAPSVQEEIEKALSRILNTEISISGSGRTDAGVHAKGQTFHFVIDKEIDVEKLRYSVNCLLPKDIHIISMKVVDDDFHSRYNVKEKTYSYTISVGENNPFTNEFSFNYLKPLNIELLCEALKPFNGEHNFKDFTSKEEDEDGFIRWVKIATEVKDNIVIIKFTGNGFMRYMIRFMVGAAIAVAEGKVDISFIENHLKPTKNREIIAYKAPSEGLVLESVKYQILV